MSLQQLVKEITALKQAVFGQPRLRIEDLQHRYGWSRTTVFRRIRDGSIPPPLHFPGQPVWRLEDVEKAELAGQLPPPASV